MEHRLYQSIEDLVDIELEMENARTRLRSVRNITKETLKKNEEATKDLLDYLIETGVDVNEFGAVTIGPSIPIPIPQRIRSVSDRPSTPYPRDPSPTTDEYLTAESHSSD